MSELVGYLLEDLGDRPVVRNGLKLSGPSSQEMLRDYLRSLVAAYGWREDFRGPNKERVPYLPPHFAAEMLGFFKTRAAYWLMQSVPDSAKQPGFIHNHMQRATEVVGEVRDGQVVKLNETNYQAAPASVAAKAPSTFPASRPAGKPHAQVLTAESTWRFLDQLQRLAIHFDVLGGQPSKLDLFVESVGEAIEELPGRVGRALDVGKDTLATWALVAVGVAGLFLAARR